MNSGRWWQNIPEEFLSEAIAQINTARERESSVDQCSDLFNGLNKLWTELYRFDKAKGRLSEEEIQKALASLVKGKTVIIIAHRFSTIRLADVIMVFENGHLVASGPHDKLYQVDPLYTALYSKQL